MIESQRQDMCALSARLVSECKGLDDEKAAAFETLWLQFCRRPGEPERPSLTEKYHKFLKNVRESGHAPDGQGRDGDC
jgi:hypothetical protein